MTTLPSTIPLLFQSSVERFADKTMLVEKKGTAYVGSTFIQIQALVHQCAAGFLHLGIQKGDRVALMSEGRNDWVVSELGVLFAGGVSVPLSVKIEELSELKFRLAHSGCKMVIVSAAHVQKIMKIRKDLPDLETIVLLDPTGTLAEDEIGFPDLLRRGSEYLQSHWQTFEKTWISISGNDYATISYTSGTTADPKGIILTHRNYTSNVEQCNNHLSLPSYYETLLILPWDHAFGHTAGVYLFMSIGASIASVQAGKTAMETLKNIPINIREIRPHFLLSVPALAKNFRKNIEKGISEKGGIIEGLFRKGVEIASEHYGDGWNDGKPIRKPMHPLFFLCDALIFKKIRASFGGRVDFMIGGAAVLDIELQKFFNAIGIPMYQGYGLTEAAPVISANTPSMHKFGSSGRVLPNLEIMITGDEGNALPQGQKGEIRVKGENVMVGYWKNERATKETLVDGWLRTGDIGYLDKDGFLYVLGREKSVLIGFDGEKYSPEGIEEAIVAHSPYLDQMMLFNDHSAYTIGLIVPNKDALLSWLKHKKLSCRTPEGQEAALKLLQEEIDSYREENKREGAFPERWLPSALIVLGEGFTEQNRMLNSTLKMVRTKIAQFYQTRIDYALIAEGKNILNHQNRMIVKRFEEGNGG